MSGKLRMTRTNREEYEHVKMSILKKTADGGRQQLTVRRSDADVRRQLLTSAVSA